MFKNDRDLKPRKKSYYPFSKNYPSRRTGTAYAIGESRTRRKKERRSAVVYAVSLVVVFVIVFLCASVILMLSKRPLEGGGDAAPAQDGQWHAVYMTDDELSGGIAFELLQNTLSESRANAVVFDFKAADGTLCAASGDGVGADIGAAGNTAADAADTVRRLKEKGYKIIARVYCFRDPIAAAQLPGAAVTEADGVTIWLDDSARSGGEPWLNPYSDTARLYLLGVIREAAAFGADMVLLDDVSFPIGRYADRAAFPGETESLFSRNAVLHDFIEQAALSAGEIPIAVSMPLSAAADGDAQRYGGGIFDSAAMFSAIDFRDSAAQSDSGNTTREQVLSNAASALSERLSENYRTKAILPIVYSADDVLFLQNAGIQNYVWIPEKDA